MTENVLVSVICTAFNQESFIKDALEGFVSQRTNFKYEVIIHDDASTDNTASIIKEYERRYPDIIKPVYQTENQYSKGVSIGKTFLFPLVKGKYIALCEGDDYWIDNNKLQMQVDYMESHSECSMCVHQAINHHVDTGEETLSTTNTKEKDYSFSEIVDGGGALFATGSTLMKKDVYFGRPDCFNQPGVGDYQMNMYASLIGTCHYLPKVMSVYRIAIPGSWTMRIGRQADQRKKFRKNMVSMLKEVNAYYDYKYNDVFAKRINEIEYSIYKEDNNLKMLKSKRFRKMYYREKYDKYFRIVKILLNK